MPLKKRKKLIGLCVICDIALIMLSYMAALALRMNVLASIPDSAEYTAKSKSFLVVLVSSIVMVIVYYILGLYDSFDTRTGKCALFIGIANGIGLLFIGTLLFLLRLTDYSRLALALYYVFSCLLVLARQLCTHKIQARRRAKGMGRVRVLLVGGGRMACRYYQTISRNADSEYTFCGYFAEAENAEIPGYLGDTAKLRQMVASGCADMVLIALEAREEEKIGDLIALCGRYGISANIIPTYNDFIPATPHVETVSGLKMIEVRSAANKGTWWCLVKRMLDIVLSLAALIVLSPVMLVTAALVKVTSPGPVIFKQIRAGKNGRPFYMYKFRSMCADAENKLADLQQMNESDGPTFKIAHDPRITRVGRVIRKTSIDELPQLVNIVKGDMSIVGPRPPLMSEIAQYSDWDWGRLAVKPGLTCYWQIGGRSDLSFAEWMQLDLKYVEEQGFWTDLKIILKTIRILFNGKGAY